jgi:hypothetical protein
LYDEYSQKGKWLFTKKDVAFFLPTDRLWRTFSKDSRIIQIGKGLYAVRQIKESQENQITPKLQDSLWVSNRTNEHGNVYTGVHLRPSNNLPVINNPKDIDTLLDYALWNDDENVHNLTITTTMPLLHQTLRDKGYSCYIVEGNNGIQLPNKQTPEYNIQTVISTQDTVEVRIRNSEHPIMANVNDVLRLRKTMEDVRQQLSTFGLNVPDLNFGFTVVKFDHARDGYLPLGVSCSYAYHDFENTLIKIYTHRSNSYYSVLRLEKQLHPNYLLFGKFVNTLLKLNFS